MEENRLARLQRYSNLGALTRLTFDNLIPEGRSGDPSDQERFRRAYQIAKDFAQSPHGWLVLAGPSGCGKTHLAAAVANYRLSQGQPAFFVVVPDFLDHLRHTFSPDSDISYDTLFEQVRQTPLLILDDLGAQSSTSWAREKLFQIINHRFNAQLPTVITISVPLEQLEERINARLTDPALSQVCLVEAGKSSVGERFGALGLELLSQMNFEGFDSRRANLSLEQQQNLGQAFRLAHSFAEAPEGWLVLLGTNGCGKTHLAAAIANYRRQQGKPVFFVVVPDFLDHLRSSFSPDSGVRYDEFFEKVKNSPLLILDDFGGHFSTPWAQEKLYQLINYRYNARLPTVVTSNQSLEEIESRISSRMADPRISLVLGIEAPDYRTDRPPVEKAKPAPPRNRRSGR